ncbi:RsmD family RNA methyltransferase [Aurantibacillus circumpalustris]|uniref:RsmD family RNA methyltransferase n=1 Tax=Aurantibacillus circumpalustris TaxID=3036359 RepID=UPI00295B3330|nr:RsmD family RNA methyltransferase [Aurantibacillus circumpalustris]
MRIIGGTHKGKVIKVPKDLPVRPTTDFAKEGLFNILSNKLDFENLSVLDLFSGTGHISLEFASRGAGTIVSVDKHFKCSGFLKSISKELNFNINSIKSDVFDFLKNTTLKFDLIFADPPYDLNEIPDIHKFVFDKGLLNANGLLIIEHGQRTKLEDLKGFTQHRKYGNVNFSFFENNE